MITIVSPHCRRWRLANDAEIMLDVGDATRMSLGDKSVDLVCGSPPYLRARTYGINAARGMAAWLELMIAASREALRVSRGPVFWVIAGETRRDRHSVGYQPGPEMLMAELWRAGIELMRPGCWYKVDPETGGGCGQPGSGGKQWLRSDWEYVVALKNPGPLPYADPLFEKRLPKFKPGGKIRTRAQDGTRAPRAFRQPKYVNPGNVIKARVGGGHQGDKECHDGEAPYPERVPAFFAQGWCPPGGWTCDPFSGTATTAVMAAYHGRNAIGFDLRESQLAIGARRIERRIAEGRSCPPPSQPIEVAL